MAGASKSVRQKVRVPLVPMQNNRIGYSETYNEDAYFYNAVAEVGQSSLTKDQITYAVKRPGVTNVADWSEEGFTEVISPGTTGFNAQGLWSLYDDLYFVNNNILYRVSSISGGVGSPTAIHSFAAGTVYDATTTKLWEEFGDDFAVDFDYYGLEIFNEGVVVLYITNGFEDIIVNRDGSVSGVKTGYNQWTANTYLKPGDKILPTAYANQGYWYMVIGEAGITAITGASEPTWPTTLGGEVTNGDVTFICMGTVDPEVIAQEYTNRVYAVGDLVTPSTESGYFYMCTTAGTASAEPGSWTQIKGDTSTATGGVVFECMGNYGGKPGLAVPRAIYLDTFIILAAYKTSDIYHSDPTDVYSWNALNFISADSFTSPIKAIARYNNYVLAFSETDGELFYNNANAEGSTLSRHESFLLQVGCYSQKTLVSTETICTWIASSQNGGKSIWMLDGFEPKEISNVWLNKTLEYEYPDPDTYAYSVRVNGHFLIIFVLSRAAALVFDVNMNLWYHWGVSTDTTGATQNNWRWHYVAVNQNDKVIYQMSRNTYDLFQMIPTSFEDSLTGIDPNVPILVQLRTHLVDFGNNIRKFGHSVDVIANRANIDRANLDEDDEITLYWADNDYVALDPTPPFATGYTLDLSLRPRVAPIGNFRRRAFMIESVTNDPVRFEALEITYTQGSQ